MCAVDVVTTHFPSYPINKADGRYPNTCNPQGGHGRDCIVYSNPTLYNAYERRNDVQKAYFELRGKRGMIAIVFRGITTN